MGDAMKTTAASLAFSATASPSIVKSSLRGTSTVGIPLSFA